MKPKHVPQRTCIACRTVAGKRGLVRLVRVDGRVEVDPTGKRTGRGAYLHPSRTCWQAVIDSNRIEQALRTKLSAENRQALVDYMQGLPETE
ncbi:MAG: YlxR family protein [Caldilineaceae bacterium]